jgi:hypothetical protein
VAASPRAEQAPKTWRSGTGTGDQSHVDALERAGGSGQRSGQLRRTVWLEAATNKMRRLPRLANAPKQCRGGKTFLLSDAAEVDHTVG